MAEGTMRKVITIPFIVVLAASAAGADTIYLKNGSIIKGKVASYADDQFVVMLNMGSDRQSSRAQIFSGDVARIEFEASPGAEVASNPTGLEPGISSPPVKTVVLEPKSEPEPQPQPVTNTPKEGTSATTTP